MKRALYYIIAIFGICSFGKVVAQAPPWDWVNPVVSTGNEFGKALDIDTLSNWVYAAGEWDGTDLSANWGAAFASGSGGTDIWLAKYDMSGSLLWAFSIESGGIERVGDITVDPFGNVYLSGTFGGNANFAGTSPTPAYVNANQEAAFLAKYNPIGQLLWMVSVETPGDCGGFGVESDGTGVYFTGYFEDAHTFDSSPSAIPNPISSLTSSANETAFLCKYDHSGNLIWLVEADGADRDLGFEIAVDAQKVYWGGDFASNSLSYWDGTRPGIANATATNFGQSDIFLAAFNKNDGSYVWDQTIHSGVDDHLRGLEADGKLFAAGMLSGNALVFPGGTAPTVTNPPLGGQEIFISSHDLGTGICDRARIEGGNGVREIRGLDTDKQGKLAITGEFTIDLNIGGTLYSSLSGVDAFVVVYDTTFVHDWVRVGGGNGMDHGMSLALDPNGDVFTTGDFSQSYNFPPNPIAAYGGSPHIYVGRIGECRAGFTYASSTFCQTDPSPVALITGNGGGTFSSPGGNVTFASTATGEIDLGGSTPGGPYDIIYTAPQGCRDTFEISIGQAPTPANAGTDQTLCGVASTTLAANTPSVGTGNWTIFSGAGGSISTPGDPASTFSGLAGQSYELIWTINSAACPSSTDTVQITFALPPTVANAGPDQDLCAVTTTTLTGNAPAVGNALWSIISGVGGNITTPTSPMSNFTGVSGQTYELVWTISAAGCPPSTDTVKITISPSPTPANAGPDQSLCGVILTTLAGNTPAVGTGSWTIFSGTGGNISTPGDPGSTFSGQAGQSYELIWTISSGACPSSTDTVQITFAVPPTAANAGPDQDLCAVTTATLAGNAPAAGNALWSIISGLGGNVTTPTSPTSSFTGVSGQTYELVWTISSAGCPSSTDTVKISFNPSPTPANAGPDQSLCGVTSTTLAGNTPAVGSGSWAIFSGAGGSIATPGDPVSTFSGQAGQSYELIWTISFVACPASRDTVQITFDPPPTTANAGPDQGLCGVTSTNLSANTPLVGTGSWSIYSGSGGSIGTANDPNSLFTGLSGQSYQLVWTISAAGCVSSTDTVQITFDSSPSPAQAGPDQDLCGQTQTSLAANVPLVGTGNWTIFSGNGGSFNSPGDPFTTFSGQSGQVYQLVWTITAANCPSNSDTVQITFYPAPSQASAGPDQSLCGQTTTDLAGNAPSVGSGSWSILSGSGGNIVNNTAPNSTFSGQAGGTYQLVWTISATACPSSSDTVEVSFYPAPTAPDAGPDQSLCGDSTTTLAANSPLVGTGMWSIASGSGGNINLPSDHMSSFSGQPGQNYQLVWTISATACPAVTDTVEVHFEIRPQDVFAGMDQQVCGRDLQLSADPGNGSWTLVSGAGSFTDPFDPQTEIKGLAAGLNVLQWTAGNPGCSDSAQVQITTFDPPVAEVGPDQQLQEVFEGQLQATLTQNGLGVWSVQQGTGLIADSLDAGSPVSQLEVGENIFRWTVSNGVCPDAYAEISIWVDESKIPTGFSPNGDNVNDNFVVRGLGIREQASLKVFNRWGDLVFQAINYQNDWGGKDLRGRDLSDDTYYIILEYTNGQSYNGYLVIRR